MDIRVKLKSLCQLCEPFRRASQNSQTYSRARTPRIGSCYWLLEREHVREIASSMPPG